MQFDKLQIDRIKRNLIDAANSCRGSVLDTFEVECGENPNWQMLRSRLLRAFGDRGLIGRIIEIIDTELAGNGDENKQK